MSPTSGRIHILSESVSRKIAAGEVIDRPAAVVRELLDNSLDAEAEQIEIHLEAGGNELVRVSDDGRGMGREDLKLCYLPHATSKIESDDDLLHVRTLGFRGEALGSMASVSRLTVVSAPRDRENKSVPHRLVVHGGKVIELAPAAAGPGTTVEVAELFYNLPARKRFLKRPQSESALVRSVCLDRALAYPHVGFRLFSGSELRSYLAPADRLTRINAAYPERTEPALLHALSGSGDGFSFELVAGEPIAARKDRKQVQIFVNRRRVWEYALVQAVEYAYRDYLHGGLFPVAYLFLDVQPELVDFNIHPAKREVRFRNLPDIHRRIVDALGSYLHAFDRSIHVVDDRTVPLSGLDTASNRPVTGSVWESRDGGARPAGQYREERTHAGLPRATQALPPQRTTGSTQNAPGAVYDLSRTFELPGESTEYRYLGQVFGLFLVVERQNRLYLVDQHAAHERIIYERLKSSSAGQELLFPVRFEVDENEDTVLRDHSEELAALGIGLAQADSGTWELTTVPAVVELEAENLIELIRELAQQPADFERELYASISCRAAVMDGDVLPRSVAEQIISSALTLTNARCPHGRPIWAEFSREELMKLVNRT